jgi:uncharacterized delta-60 repeat protein
MTFRLPRFRPFTIGRDWLAAASFTALGYLLATAATAAPGQPDVTFSGSGKISAISYGLGSFGIESNTTATAISASGQLLIAGWCYNAGTPKMCVASLQDSGQVDTSFGEGRGWVLLSALGDWSVAYALSIQSDGKILISGYCGQNTRLGCIARLNSDGSFDATFNGASATPGALQFTAPFSTQVNATAVQVDGKILIAGTCQNGGFCITRLDASGAIDFSFTGAATGSARTISVPGASGGSVNSLAIQSNGKIILVGSCGTQTSKWNFCVISLNENGSNDLSFFGPQGQIAAYSFAMTPTESDFANAVVIDAAGRIVIAGSCAKYILTCVARLHPNGSFDASFNSSGVEPGKLALGIFYKSATYSGELATYNAVRVDNYGRYVLAGACGYSVYEFCVTRLNPDGSLDTTFDDSGGNGNGVVRFRVAPNYGGGKALMLDGQNRIFVAGTCTNNRGFVDFCAIRLKGGSRVATECALNADSNPTIDIATDALLLTRYLFGFRGDALTAGALGANPTRTGQALETYLATLNLDADGDGQALAMTDGLLLLRAMLGLTGTALTQGATNTAHPNVRNAQQILTWIENTHGVACLP